MENGLKVSENNSIVSLNSTENMPLNATPINNGVLINGSGTKSLLSQTTTPQTAKTDLKKPIAKVEPLDPNEATKQNISGIVVIGVLANGTKRPATNKTTPMATATKLIKNEPRGSPKLTEQNDKVKKEVITDAGQANDLSRESPNGNEYSPKHVKNEPMDVEIEKSDSSGEGIYYFLMWCPMKHPKNRRYFKLFYVKCFVF